jgi:hypothetical protein
MAFFTLSIRSGINRSISALVVSREEPCRTEGKKKGKRGTGYFTEGKRGTGYFTDSLDP